MEPGPRRGHVPAHRAGQLAVREQALPKNVVSQDLEENPQWPRPYWKGYLKLSLVSCPVALYPASTQAEKTHFHQINTKTGHRLRQQMVDEQTGRVVDKEHEAT